MRHKHDDAKHDHHPYVPELKHLYRTGRISRREFLRNATLLGMSVAAAGTFVASCAPEQATSDPTQPPATEPATAPPDPTATSEPETSGPVRGGRLRLASQVHKVTHPAQFSWASPANQLRQVAEYLTLTDEENVTHPYLLKDWEVSDDLETWTLNLRQGINFNNGDELTSDDVVFTMNEWLNEDVGSSMLGLIGGYLSAQDIEKVDDYTVKLHLSRPEIAVPEHLFHYPALVLNHRTFEGDFIKNPHGTGPYMLEDYSEGERVLLKRREDYWQMGADDQPLPYLDELEFIDMGSDMAAWIGAIRSGDIDVFELGDQGGADVYQALQDVPNVVQKGITTGQSRVLRMRADLEPWTDARVRMALKLCQNREKILNLAYFGEGKEGQDFHVYPGHPEYCDKPIPEYNPEKAKQLLTDAGYPDGLDVEIAVGSGWPDVVSYAEVLKEDALPGGLNITINTMPNSQYWEQWTEVSLGITPWTHRPLGTMVLNLAYVGDENGDPVSWNETRWVDEEFSTLLSEANRTLDVEERRQIFCDLEQIQWERGSIGIAFWRNVWQVYRDNVHNIPAHPTLYLLINEAWKEA
jgi:peptide/nickel transport system substrate-binding protein